MLPEIIKLFQSINIWIIKIQQYFPFVQQKSNYIAAFTILSLSNPKYRFILHQIHQMLLISGFSLNNAFIFIKVKVPLFINEGEKIQIDTTTGEYLGRAK